MVAETEIQIVDTNIIPDRNAGIGSLLWDIQNPHDPDQDTPPLLGRQFAFIDVGVSRSQVSAALKKLLAGDLKMDVTYVATERPESVPYAHVHPQGARAERLRECLSRMISCQSTRREAKGWHYVVDRKGHISSVSYSYELHGNEVWESYFMGRSFLHQGDHLEFSDPELDEILALEVPKIEALIGLEMKRDSDHGQSEPLWDGFKVKKNPLEAGLAEFGITLQKTAVPQRVQGRQNVIFLGNVLNQYPQPERDREFNRVVAHMDEGDIAIIQMDGIDTPSIEVLRVKTQDARKAFERVRWINTRTLEVQVPGRNLGSWQDIHLKPWVNRVASCLVECLEMRSSTQDRHQQSRKALVHQSIAHVCVTFFRALPVEKTLRIAIREALRRLPSEAGLKGIPVFTGDTKDAYSGPLGSALRPLVSDEDILRLAISPSQRDRR